MVSADQKVGLRSGMRMQLLPLGVQRCPNYIARTGAVVRLSEARNVVRVLLDGTKSVRSIHPDYLMPAAPQEEPKHERSAS